MVVNFRIRRISRGVRKLIQTPILIKKNVNKRTALCNVLPGPIKPIVNPVTYQHLIWVRLYVDFIYY
jgi:hypothetical protein